MGLNELIYWYQRKIGTYDKEQWEKTVEQRILGGFTYVPMRTAKLKTEFIDVDLVRGSSFPKAKPKHGLSTVAYLALRRLFFLPLCRKWWIQQTSSHVFAIFLLLYSLQFFNIFIYVYYLSKENEADIVPLSEVLVPIVMMLTLCTIHSHIVSTNSGPAITHTHKRQRIVRRSRQSRYRAGKSRIRQSSRIHEETKSSPDIVPEKLEHNEILSSVKFSKKVTIDKEHFNSRVRVGVSIPQIGMRGSKEVAVSADVHPPPKKEITGRGIPPEVSNPEDVGYVNAVHLDDDGFESLNGNVSSDNDKSTANGRQSVLTKTALQENAQMSEIAEEFIHASDNSSSRRLAHPRKLSAPNSLKNNHDILDGEADVPNESENNRSPKSFRERQQQCESEEEGECEETAINHLTEATTSATEWMGVTTNSDECSYSSELEESDGHSETNVNCSDFIEHPFSWEFEIPPSISLSSSCASSDRVSCTIWTRRDIKKAELSVLDISSAIIARVESMPENMHYFYGGLVLSVVLCLLPSIKRFTDHISTESNNATSGGYLIPCDLTLVNFETYTDMLCKIIGIAFGGTLGERIVVIISAFERLILSCLLFFLLAVAERSYKQRLHYAKLFSHLTSSRRARKSDLPHFRLNKVRNIKTWLSVRSYLKRRGPQRSVDVIVSAVFIITLLLLSFVSLELIKNIENLHAWYNVEALLWSFFLGMFILRFMTLGTKINKKYRNLSVLITEQINLYLQIEQKPHKKEELMVANSVLKLAADLIKELESPFKISGLSANPYLYTITKVVLLSALSGVLSELLGFKLKLHKIKIK